MPKKNRFHLGRPETPVGLTKPMSLLSLIYGGGGKKEFATSRWMVGWWKSPSLPGMGCSIPSSPIPSAFQAARLKAAQQRQQEAEDELLGRKWRTRCRVYVGSIYPLSWMPVANKGFSGFPPKHVILVVTVGEWGVNPRYVDRHANCRWCEATSAALLLKNSKNNDDDKEKTREHEQ